MIHMKCYDLFCVKIDIFFFKVSSAAIVIGALSVIVSPFAFLEIRMDKVFF